MNTQSELSQELKIDLFKLNVLEYFIMSSDPARHNLAKIYRKACDLGIREWLHEAQSGYDDLWIDFDNGHFD